MKKAQLISLVVTLIPAVQAIAAALGHPIDLSWLNGLLGGAAVGTTVHLALSEPIHK